MLSPGALAGVRLLPFHWIRSLEGRSQDSQDWSSVITEGIKCLTQIGHSKISGTGLVMCWMRRAVNTVQRGLEGKSMVSEAASPLRAPRQQASGLGRKGKTTRERARVVEEDSL